MSARGRDKCTEICGYCYGKVDACTNGVYQALSPPKRPGDEASSGADTLEYTPLDMRCMNMAISHSPHVYVPVIGLLCFSTDNHCRRAGGFQELQVQILVFRSEGR